MAAPMLKNPAAAAAAAAADRWAAPGRPRANTAKIRPVWSRIAPLAAAAAEAGDCRRALPPSPAQHEAVTQFANMLSTTGVDEVGRGYEFHQPLPAGLMAVAISGCARLCGNQTSVWRQAISTIMTDRASGVLLEVSMFQSGLSRIDFTARCAAGAGGEAAARSVEEAPDLRRNREG